MIKRAIQLIREDSFVRNNAVFFVGSMTAAVLNYAFHPVMSRLLGVEEFGDVQALLSILYIGSVLLTGFNLIVVNIVQGSSTERQDTIRQTLSELYTIALATMGIIAVILLFTREWIQDAFKLSASLPLIPLAVYLLLGVRAFFHNGALQGLHAFRESATNNVILAGGRLLFASVLVAMLGFAVAGALAGIALSVAMATFYSAYALRGKFVPTLTNIDLSSPALRKELRYAALVLSAFGFSILLFSSDTLVVKYFFDPETAGLYAGIATIARIIYFAAASVVMVLIASVHAKAPDEHNRATLRKGVKLIGIMGIGLMLLFTLAPTFITTLLLGHEYASLASLLPLAGSASFVASLTFLLAGYYMALRDRATFAISGLGVLLLILLTTFRHDSLEVVVWNYLLTGIFATLVFSLHKKRHATIDV